MEFKPFEAVTDYPSMLNKIAWCTFVVAAASIWVLGWQVPAVGSLLSHWKVSIKLVELDVNLGVILGAALLALLSRLSAAHDLLSDVLHIRVRFDVNYILSPMAVRSGLQSSPSVLASLRVQRKALMREVFYEYATSSSPKIDKHYVTLALDNWTWYWAFLEASFLIAIAFGVTVAFSEWIGAIMFGVTEVALMVGLFGFWRRAIRNASAQIDEIFRDQARMTAIAKVFGALPG